MTLCVAAMLICSWLSPIDEIAMQQVDVGLKRALVTYGTARVLLGAVSVFQGTQVNVSPAGIGATLAPGQMLAPAAEMLKQFSDLMLLVSVSFGIQKLMITMGTFKAISLALTVVAIAWTLHYVWQRRSPAWLTKIFIVLLMVRFAVPLTVLGTDVLFQTFLNNEYKVSQEMISSVSAAPETQTSPTPENTQKPGVFKRLRDVMRQPVANAVIKYEEIKGIVDQTVAHMVTLIGVFVLQTMVIPLMLLWGLYGLAKLALQLPFDPDPRPRPFGVGKSEK